LSVVHVVIFVRADGDVDIGALVLEYIFDATPRRSIPAVFWPYEDLGRLHVAESLAIPVPTSEVGVVLGWPGSVGNGYGIEERDMVRRLHNRSDLAVYEKVDLLAI
jgi:hypothetical protein